MAASTKYEEIADDEENSTSTVNTELDRAKYEKEYDYLNEIPTAFLFDINFT